MLTAFFFITNITIFVKEDSLMQTITELCTTVVGKALLALIVWIVGKFIIKKILGLVEKIKALDKIEPNTRTFVVSAVRWLLYIMLVVSIVAILGVPMASVITVLGTAGAAIALSLQGSLSNLAGGIMLVIFKPFKVGDFVEAAGVSGFVKEITMFYTVAKSENPAAIQNLILETLSANEKVLKDPSPFARLSGGTNEAMQFTARAWCKTADYWDVYFDLTQSVTEKLGANGVQAPAVRVISGK